MGMRGRWAVAALLAIPGLAWGTHALAATVAGSPTATSTGTLTLCAVEEKTGVAVADYSVTGRKKPVEVKANTCRSLSVMAVGDVQIYQLPEAGQNPSSITVSPASRQDGRANVSKGTVAVDIAPGATTTVTYTNQS